MLTYEYKEKQALAGFPVKTESVVIASGAGILEKFTIIGKCTGSMVIPDSGTPQEGNTGNGTLDDIVSGNAIKKGAYKITCSAVDANTIFSVTDPEGNILPEATVGIEYINPQIEFTITQGDTVFVVGDSFTIGIGESEGNGKYIKSIAGATDGSANPKNMRILAERIDATESDVHTTAYSMGDFDSARLVFGDGLSSQLLKDDLRTYGIILKDDVKTY